MNNNSSGEIELESLGLLGGKGVAGCLGGLSLVWHLIWQHLALDWGVDRE